MFISGLRLRRKKIIIACLRVVRPPVIISRAEGWRRTNTRYPIVIIHTYITCVCVCVCVCERVFYHACESECKPINITRSFFRRSKHTEIWFSSINNACFCEYKLCTRSCTIIIIYARKYLQVLYNAPLYIYLLMRYLVYYYMIRFIIRVVIEYYVHHPAYSMLYARCVYLYYIIIYNASRIL